MLNIIEYDKFYFAANKKYPSESNLNVARWFFDNNYLYSWGVRGGIKIPMIVITDFAASPKIL